MGYATPDNETRDARLSISNSLPVDMKIKVSLNISCIKAPRLS